MPDRFHIRRARHDDAVAECVAAAYAPYVERMRERPAPVDADYVELVARGFVSVAMLEHGLAGIIVSWPADDHVFVENVAVWPERQGLGVGRLLLTHADELAVRSGLPDVRLYTNEAMTENLDFYGRLGFVETHRAVEDGYRRVYFTRAIQR